jgi:hypothetical protein
VYVIFAVTDREIIFGHSHCTFALAYIEVISTLQKKKTTYIVKLQDKNVRTRSYLHRFSLSTIWVKQCDGCYDTAMSN